MKLTIIIFAILSFISYMGLTQEYWEQIITPIDSDIRSIEINSTNHIYLGLSYTSFGGGIYRSMDLGNSWQFIGLENAISDIFISAEDYIYAGSDCVYFSSNSFDWDTISDQINPMSIYVNDELILVGTWTGIYKSDDHGISWTQVMVGSQYTEVVREIIQNKNTSELFAGSTNFIGGGGIYHSTDGGNSWEHFGLYDHYVSSLAFNSNNDLFAGSRGHTYYYMGGVHMLPNGQSEWITLNNELLVTSLVINQEDEIYIGCSKLDGATGGVHRSIDNGQNWENISAGIASDDQEIDHLEINSEGYIFALEHYAPTSLYKSINSTLTSIKDKNIGHSKNILSVYPNPFSLSTNIIIKVNNKSYVKIIIRNNAGKIVTLLDLGLKSIGEYSTLFHAIGLGSGIYYATVMFDGIYVKTKKIVLMNK